MEISLKTDFEPETRNLEPETLNPRPKPETRKEVRPPFVTYVRIASMLKMEQERRVKVMPEDFIKFEQNFLLRKNMKMFANLAEGKESEIRQSHKRPAQETF